MKCVVIAVANRSQQRLKHAYQVHKEILAAIASQIIHAHAFRKRNQPTSNRAWRNNTRHRCLIRMSGDVIYSLGDRESDPHDPAPTYYHEISWPYCANSKLRSQLKLRSMIVTVDMASKSSVAGTVTPTPARASPRMRENSLMSC